MKLLTTILLFWVTTVNATTYYVKATGNDANTGTSDAQAWATLSKVNGTSYSAGDNILFNRGDVWVGTLASSSSGNSSNNITYGAYGTGNKPIITGLSTVTSWTSLGSNIYRASVSNGGQQLHVLLLNGTIQAKGRLPKMTVGFGGYYNINSRSNGSITSGSINGANYTGAEVVIRKSHHIIDRRTITGHSGSTITFTDPADGSYDGGNGFFIQNHISTLTQQGEWMYDASGNYLYMYLLQPPSNYTIEVSNQASTLFNVNNKQYNKIDGIYFRGSNGDNVSADVNYAPGFQIVNSTSKFAAGSGIKIVNCYNIAVTSDTIQYCLNVGILSQSNVTNAAYTYNIIDNIGMLPGNGLAGGGGSALAVLTGGNITFNANIDINYNRLTNIGFGPISLFGGGIRVKYNYIDYFNLIVDDDGGIYFQRRGNDADYTSYDSCFIEYNTVLNGIGNGYGLSSGESWGDGLYSDDRVNKVRWTGNNVYNMSRYGGYIHTSFDQKWYGNTFVNNKWAIGAEQNDAEFPTITIHGLVIKKNTIVVYANQFPWLLRSAYPDNRGGAGIIDSNFIYQPSIGASSFITSRKESGGTNGYGTGAPAIDYNITFTQWMALGGNYDIVTPNTMFTNAGTTRFEFNETGTSRSNTLPGVYTDLLGTSYIGSINMPAYSSRVLSRTGDIPTQFIQIRTARKLKTNAVTIP